MSPYTPGGIPRHLAGRSADLAAIKAFLAPVIAYGEKANAQLVLHGPRGIGKTSLMSAAADAAREDGFVVAWTSCARQGPFLADLAWSIDRELERVGARPKAAQWRAVLDRVTVEVAVPAVAKISAEIKQGHHHQRPPSGSVSAIEDLLHGAAVAAAGANSHRNGVGLMVALDELHAGDPGELAILLNASQNLNQQAQHPVAIVGAGLPSTLGVLTTAATFGERSRWLKVSPLSDSALAEAVIEPAAALGVAWDAEAVRMVLDAADGYPHFAQVMANAVWENAQPEAGGTIGVRQARAGIVAGRAEIDDLHRARWDSLTAHEQRVVLAIATLSQQVPVSRAEVERVLGSNISVYRSRLIDKAVIEEAGRGLLRFTLPGFAAFALAETDEAPPRISVTGGKDSPQQPAITDAPDAGRGGIRP